MNAIPVVAQTPLVVDQALVSNASAYDSLNLDQGGHFAALLSHAGGQSAHKTATTRSANTDPGGGQLPATGGLVPPPAAAHPPSEHVTATRPPAEHPTATRPPAASSTSSASAVAAAAGSTAAGTANATAAREPATRVAPATTADQRPTGTSATSSATSSTTSSATQGAFGAATAASGFAAPAGLPEGDPDPADSPPAVSTTAAAAGPASPAGSANPAGPNAAAGRNAPAGSPTAAGSATPATTTPAGSNPPAAKASAVTSPAGTLGPNIAEQSPAPPSRAATNEANVPQLPAVTNYAAPVPPPATAEVVAAANPATRPASEPPSPALAAEAEDEDASAPVAGLALAPAPAEAAAIDRLATLATLADGADRQTQSGTTALPDTAVGAADGAPWGVNLTGVSPGATSNPAPILNVTARVDSPEFGQGVADRVSAMVDSNLNTAKLEVNPPQLGPIEVRIAVQGDHAQVWLMSHSAVTRDALESSSSKLRDMLGAQGFAQVSVDISQRNFQERPPAPRPYVDGPAANPLAPTAAARAVTATALATRALDAYA